MKAGLHVDEVVWRGDPSKCSKCGEHAPQEFGESWRGKAKDRRRLASYWQGFDEQEVVCEGVMTRLCCSKVRAS